jgi:TldD protein
MTNINLLPGKGRLADLIAETEYGIYFETNKSWSIDDRRVNFQFGTEIAWEIKNGKKVRMLKNALYTGITPEFWRSCVAICGPEEWRLWGLPNCGKGEPGQVMQVGHGAAPAKFRNVQGKGGRMILAEFSITPDWRRGIPFRLRCGVHENCERKVGFPTSLQPWEPLWKGNGTRSWR